MQDYNDNYPDRANNRNNTQNRNSARNGKMQNKNSVQNNIRRIPDSEYGQPRAAGQGPSRPVRQAARPAQGGASGSAGPAGRPPQGSAPRPVRPSQGGASRPVRPSQGGASRPAGQAGRPVQGGAPRPANPSARPPQGGTNKRRPQGAAGNKPPKAPKKGAGKPVKHPSSQQAAKKKRRKIILFVAEVFLLLTLLAALWAVNKTQQIQLIKIDQEKVSINQKVIDEIEQGTSNMKGYRNIALFGVDSRNKELDKNTRTDVIMVASINLDTKEVKLVSVYRDTWLNMTTDKYSKANAAYAKGGAEQAIGMLNMNLDLDITDFVTVGFDAVIDVVNAIGGVEIDVTQEEIDHLNSYQVSMVGRVVGKNAVGEDEYDAVEGVEYTPVKSPGLQKLNGLQATAYCRIRYVGGDGARTMRQRKVLEQIAKKAMTLNPSTLNKIADAVFGEIATSLEMTEILSLLADITNYQIGESSGFPFADNVVMNGHVGNASVVVPVDLTKNVTLLHEFLFEDEDYTPSDTVKKCSQKIASDTGIRYNGE